MPKVSVIVPVYRVEKYLDQCVASVCAQTFTDWELILVDDGSPDRCGAMCDEWAAKDGRIRVIHRENGGPSAARNSGIVNASGEYLFFLDADDRLFPSAVQAMVDYAEQTAAELVFIKLLFSNIRKLRKHFFMCHNRTGNQLRKK